MLTNGQVVTLRFPAPGGATRRSAVVRAVNHALPLGPQGVREGPFTTFEVTAPSGLCYTFPCLDSLLPTFVEGWTA
jgi:hypothetical protein